MHVNAYRIWRGARDLAREAQQSGLLFVGYLLEMAAEEAKREGDVVKEATVTPRPADAD